MAVLEARDRVGGRTLNADIGGGEVVEVGGQWVGPQQTSLLALARELDVATFPTQDDGDSLLEHQGRLQRYRGLLPRMSKLVLADVVRWPTEVRTSTSSGSARAVSVSTPCSSVCATQEDDPGGAV